MSNLKCRHQYIYELRFDNPCHMWTCVGAMAGLHLHITDHGEEHEAKYGHRYSGGIEIHYRFPPKYMEDRPPSHDECFLLKCPCWHDGSSSQATDFWIPTWLAVGNDHDRMFEMIESDLRRKLEGTEFAGFEQMLEACT